MLKLIFACIICFFSYTSAFATTMIVKVPVLNVRKCPNTDCGIVSKLSKGDKVKVAETTKGWAKVELTKEANGYVISRSLRKSYFYLWYYVVGIIILFAIYGKYIADKELKQEQERERSRQAAWELETKCPKCGTLGAMTNMTRQCVGQRKSKTIKTTRTQYKDYTKTQEHLVPATTYLYKVKTKCTNCGYVAVSSDSETLAD